MVKKVEKIKKQGKNPEKNKSGFKFGRNLGSFLIIIFSLVLLFFMIFIPYSYISVYNKNKVEPFANQSVYTDYQANVEKNAPDREIVYKDVKRMNARDFDVFTLDFVCTNINPESHKMSFKLNINWNENTSKLSTNESLLPVSKNSSSTVTAVVGVASEWVKFETYASQRTLKVTNANKDKDKAATATFSLTGIEDYPLKANTWPVKINVSSPNAYLFLSFAYKDNKKGEIHEAYILEFSFDDYYSAKGTNGAFPNK